MKIFFCAYRYAAGEVEGFKGMGFNKERARQDAINQIGRKICIIRESGANKNEEFEHSRLIEDKKSLSVVSETNDTSSCAWCRLWLREKCSTMRMSRTLDRPKSQLSLWPNTSGPPPVQATDFSSWRQSAKRPKDRTGRIMEKRNANDILQPTPTL